MSGPAPELVIEVCATCGETILDGDRCSSTCAEDNTLACDRACVKLAKYRLVSVKELDRGDR